MTEVVLKQSKKKKYNALYLHDVQQIVRQDDSEKQRGAVDRCPLATLTGVVPL